MNVRYQPTSKTLDHVSMQHTSRTLLKGWYLKHLKCVSIEAKPLHSNCAQCITPLWITNEVYMRPLRVFEHTSCFYNLTQNTCWWNPVLWMNSSVVNECEIAFYRTACHVLFVMRRHDLWLSNKANSTSSVQWDPCSHLFIVACSCRLQLCRLMHAATPVCIVA